MKHIVAVSLLLSIVTVIALSGCASDSADPEKSNAPSPSSTNGEHDHADQGASGQSDMEKMKAELAKLSPEDAKSAEKQHTCPVSGHMLGKMGAPKKIDVNGQHVWICCDACKDELLENPDKYLAKLNK